ERTRPYAIPDRPQLPLDSRPQMFGRGDLRKARGQRDSELDLLDLAAAPLARLQVGGDALSLHRRQFAVIVGRKPVCYVPIEHRLSPGYSPASSAPRRCASLRARNLWLRLRREPIVPFEHPSAFAISS